MAYRGRFLSRGRTIAALSGFTRPPTAVERLIDAKADAFVAELAEVEPNLELREERVRARLVAMDPPPGFSGVSWEREAERATTLAIGRVRRRTAPIATLGLLALVAWLPLSTWWLIAPASLHPLP